MTESFADRFWRRVDKSGDCWTWRGQKDGDGYGRVLLDGGKSTGAHRAAYALVHGEIAAGLKILHKCDNPPCCNPDHLAPGSQKQNMQECIERGRKDLKRLSSSVKAAIARDPGCRTGERNGNAKVTAGMVAAIRAEYTQQFGMKSALGRKYGLTNAMVGRIVSGSAWKGIEA